MIKKTLLICVLLCSLALPGLAQIPEWTAPLRLEMTAKVEEWNLFQNPTKQALIDWIQNSHLTLRVGKDAQEALLQFQGQDVLRHAQTDQGAYLYPADLLFLGTPEQAKGLNPFLSLPLPMDWTKIPSCFARDIKGLEAAIPAGAKIQKKQSTLKNVGKASLQSVFEAEAETWNSLRPSLQQKTKALFEASGLSLPEALAQFLTVYRFEGKNRLTRFFDAEERLLGWRFDGQVSKAGEDPRKVRLLFAFEETKGLFLDLRADAKRGRNTTRAALSARWQDQALWADGRLRRQIDKEKTTASLDLSLRCQDGFSGQISLQIHQPDRKPLRLRLRPRLKADQNGLKGTIGFHKEEQRQKLRLLFDLSLTPDDAPIRLPEKGRKIVLSSLSPAEQAKEQIVLEDSLAHAITPYLYAVPKEDRLLIIHDIGRIRRAHDPSLAPVPKITPTDTP